MGNMMRSKVLAGKYHYSSVQTDYLARKFAPSLTASERHRFPHSFQYISQHVRHKLAVYINHQQAFARKNHLPMQVGWSNLT